MHRQYRLLTALGLVLSTLYTHVQATEVLRLAITTSFRDSGLADKIIPVFETQNNLRIELIAVGSGFALEIARRGDVDALVAHAPPAELEFMQQGWGSQRELIMYNYFLILGPPEPELATTDVISLLRTMVVGNLPFVSRGDDSGTHKKEQTLWQAAGIKPQGKPWYVSVGQGMAATLQIAAQKQAFVLSDSGTWRALQGELPLQVKIGQHARLKNDYHIILVNPERHPHVNHKAAKQLLQFLRSPEGQHRIAAYRIQGERIFYSVQ